MSKEIFNTCAWRFGNPNDYKEVFNDIAEDLTKLNYQKVNEDSVVLSKERYEWLTCCFGKFEEIMNDIKELAHKETAEKILKWLKGHLSCMGFSIVKAYFQEQFGVKIKE